MYDRLDFYDLFNLGRTLFNALTDLESFFFTTRHFSSEGVFLDLFQKVFGDLSLDLPAMDISVAGLLLGYGLPWLLTYKLLKFFTDLIL